MTSHFWSRQQVSLVRGRIYIPQGYAERSNSAAMVAYSCRQNSKSIMNQVKSFCVFVHLCILSAAIRRTWHVWFLKKTNSPHSNVMVMMAYYVILGIRIRIGGVFYYSEFLKLQDRGRHYVLLITCMSYAYDEPCTAVRISGW